MELLTREQLDELRAYDSPTVCNALECFGLRPSTQGYMRPGMVRRTPDATPVVGYAATARVSARHPSATAPETLMRYYEHVRESPDPTIAVVQDIDDTPVASFWGEVQATVHLSLGCVGTVMQGGVRDIAEAGAMGFHFHSTEINVSHGYIHVESCACPVDILGLTVRPGDLLHMDRHGVVNIPPEAAPRLAEACRAMIKAEYPMLEPCRKAVAEGRKPTMAELAQWRRDMTDARRELAKPFAARA